MDSNTHVYLLVITQETLTHIASGLGEIPTKHGAPVIENINGQLKAQQDDPAKFVTSIEALLAPLKVTLKM